MIDDMLDLVLESAQDAMYEDPGHEFPQLRALLTNPAYRTQFRRLDYWLALPSEECAVTALLLGWGFQPTTGDW